MLKKFSRKILSTVLTVAMIGAMSTNVMASEVENCDEIPYDVTKFATETNQEVICSNNGIYTVGDATFIDVNVHKGFVDENSATNTTNVDGNSMFDVPFELATPYGNKPPSVNSLWDWSNGEYYGSFEMVSRVFTNYRFTGYSTYRVKAQVSDSGIVGTAGLFSVQSIQEFGGIGAIYNASNNYCDIYFTGCQPSERLAFAVEKPYDGYSSTGSIRVSGV